jgi:hypothetical protein
MAGGHQLATDGDTLPVLLVLAVGLDADDLAAWAEELAAQQVLTASFRPYWLTDSADLALVRRYGWVVDTIMARDRWARLGVSGDYDDYLRRRVTTAARVLDAPVLPLSGAPPTSWPARAQLLAALAAVRPARW